MISFSLWPPTRFDDDNGAHTGRKFKSTLSSPQHCTRTYLDNGNPLTTSTMGQTWPGVTLIAERGHSRKTRVLHTVHRGALPHKPQNVRTANAARVLNCSQHTPVTCFGQQRRLVASGPAVDADFEHSKWTRNTCRVYFLLDKNRWEIM